MYKKSYVATYTIMVMLINVLYYKGGRPYRFFINMSCHNLLIVTIVKFYRFLKVVSI